MNTSISMVGVGAEKVDMGVEFPLGIGITPIVLCFLV